MDKTYSWGLEITLATLSHTQQLFASWSCAWPDGAVYVWILDERGSLTALGNSSLSVLSSPVYICACVEERGSRATGQQWVEEVYGFSPSQNFLRRSFYRWCLPTEPTGQQALDVCRRELAKCSSLVCRTPGAAAATWWCSLLVAWRCFFLAHPHTSMDCRNVRPSIGEFGDESRELGDGKEKWAGGGESERWEEWSGERGEGLLAVSQAWYL
jgi:hypothetical protein